MDLINYNSSERLKDGTKVLIRAIRPDDKDGFARAFEHLSDTTIYRRFFAQKKQITEKELKIATEIDFVRVVALVTEIEKNGERSLIGACRYVAIDENDPPRRAEVAFTVFDAWQGKGLGKLLFKHLVDIGKSMGIGRFEAVVLSENVGMRKIFSSVGLKKVNIRSDVREVHFDIYLNN
jgi:RimJ/RimL family protein N-acetyltransferase